MLYEKRTWRKIKDDASLLLGTTTITLLVMSSSGLSACVQRDYLYHHVVSGRMVDTEGKPLPAARVFRGESDAASETYGLTSIYARHSAADGGFRFEYAGLGPKPESHHTWHLIATKLGYQRTALTLEIPWSTGAGGQPQGYIMEGLTMTMQAAPLENSTSSTSPQIDGTSLPYPLHLSLRAGQSLALAGGIKLTFVASGHLTLPNGQHVMTTEFLLEQNHQKKQVPLFQDAFGKWQELFHLRWRVLSGDGGPSPTVVVIEVDKPE